MKVRTIQEITGSDRHVVGHGFESLRLLLARDNMGFSLHKTIIPKGGPYHWHYRHHFEACYCVSGEGLITDLSNGNTFPILPDTVYILDENDNHEFEAVKDTVLISIFNPPIIGSEIHQEDGSYTDGGYFDLIARDILNAVNFSTNDYDAIESIKDILKINKNERV